MPTQRRTLEHARHDSVEWHRRGMRSPAELETLVARRIAASDHTPELTYADFFQRS